MSPPPRSKAHALEENGGLSTLMEHLLMSQSSSRLSWRRMFSLQGRTGVWTGRADSCSTGSPPPPSPPPPPSQPPSVSSVSPAPRLVAASAANLSWSSFYLLQCLTDIHFVNSVGTLILSSVNAYRCDPSDQKLDQMICSIVHNYAASLHCIMGQTHTS